MISQTEFRNSVVWAEMSLVVWISRLTDCSFTVCELIWFGPTNQSPAQPPRHVTPFAAAPRAPRASSRPQYHQQLALCTPPPRVSPQTSTSSPSRSSAPTESGDSSKSQGVSRKPPRGHGMGWEYPSSSYDGPRRLPPYALRLLLLLFAPLGFEGFLFLFFLFFVLFSFSFFFSRSSPLGFSHPPATKP